MQVVNYNCYSRKPSDKFRNKEVDMVNFRGGKGCDSTENFVLQANEESGY